MPIGAASSSRRSIETGSQNAWTRERTVVELLRDAIERVGVVAEVAYCRDAGEQLQCSLALIEHVDVHVPQARQQYFTGGVDHLGPARRLNVGVDSNCFDPVTPHPH